MYRKLARDVKKLSKMKYIHCIYYKDSEKCFKTYKNGEIDVKVGIENFGIALFEIDFKNQVPITNIDEIKFSNNQFEKLDGILKGTIYVKYINYNAFDKKQGCVSQRLVGNKLSIIKEIGCFYRFKMFPDTVKKMFDENYNRKNRVTILTLAKGLEVETINYFDIEYDTSLDFYSKNSYSTVPKIVRNVKDLKKLMKKYKIKK